MKINPQNDWVLVKRDMTEEKTKSGIYIPDTAREPLTRGEVIAVGPGKVFSNGRRQEPGVKQGDRVVFGKYSGSEFEHDGEKRMFMKEEEIYGVIEEEG